MSFIFALICGMGGSHIKGIFDLKEGLLFHHMFAIFLCLNYMFDLYLKSSFYFPYYAPFVASKYNSPFL